MFYSLKFPVLHFYTSTQRIPIHPLHIYTSTRPFSLPLSTHSTFLHGHFLSHSLHTLHFYTAIFSPILYTSTLLHGYSPTVISISAFFFIQMRYNSSYFELVRTKIDQQSSWCACNLEIIQNLGIMFVQNALDCFQLHYNLILDYQVCKILTEAEAVSIIHLQRLLCLNFQACLLQTMAQAVFIDLFQQSCSKIDMQVVSHLPYFGKQFADFNIFSLFIHTNSLYISASTPLHFYTANPHPSSTHLHFYTAISSPTLYTSTLLHGHYPFSTHSTLLHGHILTHSLHTLHFYTAISPHPFTTS